MKKIWLVDDDEEMIHAVQLMLKLLGFSSTYYLGARPAALALLSKKRPDLMILDINMPEVSGLDLLEFIRRRRDLRNIPVVMLSTEVDDINKYRASDLGADAYVAKPVTIEELEKAIKEAFEKHSAEDAHAKE